VATPLVVDHFKAFDASISERQARLEWEAMVLFN
jgi:hypothetical protein